MDAARIQGRAADVGVAPHDLLITDALAERPRRNQNSLAEINALHDLAHQLATHSEGLIVRLVELAVELGNAGSAGVSLLEQSEGEAVFRWVALAGAFKPHVGGSTPRDHSPCGLCLDRNEPILVHKPQRVFKYFNDVQPPIVEGLILPLHGNGGRPLGTIWVISHDDGRLFDAGTVEVLARLATFSALAMRLAETAAEKDRLVLAAQQEITERKRTEEVLRASEARLRHQFAVTRTITDNTASGLFLKDGAGCPTFLNPAAERMFGYTLEELRGRPLHESVHQTHPDGTPCPISECLLDRSAESLMPVREHETVFVRKDGSFVPVSCSVSPLEHDGNTIGSVLEVRDITDRKRAEEHRELFMREMDHRVKNILATVQAVAMQTLSRDEVSEALRGRIGALAEVQGLLAARQWENVDLGALVEAELAPYGGGDDRTTIAGESVRVPAGAAQTLALVLHELTTNAAKYGALSAPEGRVEVTWRVRDDADKRCLSLIWAEAGGPPVVAPTSRGFGSRLIERSVAGALGGDVQLEFRPEGLRCTIDVPLPRAP